MVCRRWGLQMMASLPRCRARLASRWAAARLRHRHATSLTHTINRVAVIRTATPSVARAAFPTVFGNRDANIATLKINMLDV